MIRLAKKFVVSVVKCVVSVVVVEGCVGSAKATKDIVVRYKSVTNNLNFIKIFGVFRFVRKIFCKGTKKNIICKV